jgi:hypothetical protein
LLEAIIEPGDRVTIEGDNQKQADFLEHDESGRSGPLTSPLVGEVGSHRKMRSG